MIINDKIKKNQFCPFIPTEETIFKLLKEKKDKISDKYELMPYPLANLINNFGVNVTNNIIKNLKTDKIRVFVCQHILVDKLNFEDSDIVFTPHSFLGDKFHSIPHYALNYDEKYIKQNKKRLFSFIGSSKTHKIRKEIIEVYPENCYDSNEVWGLDKKIIKENFKEKYIELLGDSTFSLCPRGTGVSSVRLFESMAMNSIPVIIADGYKKPFREFIDWDKFSIQILEKDINKINDILKSIPEKEIKNKQKFLKSIYNTYFCNEKIDTIILEFLKK